MSKILDEAIQILVMPSKMGINVAYILKWSKQYEDQKAITKAKKAISTATGTIDNCV